MENDPALKDYATAIENQTIRTIVIRNWPDDNFLYNVFLRLNTGSLPLSTQELRQALHPGKFIDFADEFSIGSNQIQKVLNIDKPDYRMRDVELVIRYFAFKYYINEYTGNLKNFFDSTVKKLNKSWLDEEAQIKRHAKELNKAIDFTFSIWGNDAFRKWKNGKYQGRFNRAVFDVMVYYFSDPHMRDAARLHIQNIQTKFRELCSSDVDFLNSFETSTKNMQPTDKRYSTWGKALREITGFDIGIPDIR